MSHRHHGKAKWDVVTDQMYIFMGSPAGWIYGGTKRCALTGCSTRMRKRVRRCAVPIACALVNSGV